MSDTDKPAGVQTVTQNNDPWAGQQPYLQPGYQASLDEVLNKPKNYFPGSTVVPFSNQSEQAMQLGEARALNGSPVAQAANNNIQSTLNGDYLSGNPYLGGMLDQIQAKVQPMADARFAQAGRFGSGMHARALEDGMMSAGTQLGYQNYGDERNRQMQAASLAPGLANQDYTDIGMLGQIGAQREAKAGQQVADQSARWDFGQNEAQNRIAAYQALIQGGNVGGQSTTQQPVYSGNGLATGLGMAGTAAGIAGSLFGKGGMFPNTFS